MIQTRPELVNLDSPLDWSSELGEIWSWLDWDELRASAAPSVDQRAWDARRDELGLVALVSDLTIGSIASSPAFDGRRTEESELGWLREQWRARQRPAEGDEDRRPRQLGAEDPVRRPPRWGTTGVADALGIYVDRAETALAWMRLADRVAPELHERPAIFLCPVRIWALYPAVLAAYDGLREPLALADHPALVNFRMTLLHELGHHFFPVHRSGGGPFLNEGLANVFVDRNCDARERTWLLYKSWLLQPPEYSAYRPLHALCQADADARGAIEACFLGTLDGWRALAAKGDFEVERKFRGSTQVGLGLDSAPARGLRGELRDLIPQRARAALNWGCGEHVLIDLQRHGGMVRLSPDLLAGLYGERDLSEWVLASDVPDEFWSGWGNSSSCPPIDWPFDSIAARPEDLGRWLELLAKGSGSHVNWSGRVAFRAAATILERHSSLRNHPQLRDSLAHAHEVLAGDACWFHKVDAIRLIGAGGDRQAIDELAEMARRCRFDGHVGEALAQVLAARGMES